jgi:hypothetical protein
VAEPANKPAHEEKKKNLYLLLLLLAAPLAHLAAKRAPLKAAALPAPAARRRGEEHLKVAIMTLGSLGGGREVGRQTLDA